MLRFVFGVVSLGLIAASATADPAKIAANEKVIGHWSGTGNSTLPGFHVDGPWTIRWSSDSHISLELHKKDGEGCSECFSRSFAGEAGVLAFKSSPDENGEWPQEHFGDVFISVASNGRWDLTAAFSPMVRKSPGAPGESPPETNDPIIAELRSDWITIAPLFRLADKAVVCGLRSQRWYGTMNTGLSMSMDAEEADLRRRAKDIPAFDVYVGVVRAWAVKYTVAPLPSQAECRKMVNSPEMDNLDRVESQITGNYH